MLSADTVSTPNYIVGALKKTNLKKTVKKLYNAVSYYKLYLPLLWSSCANKTNLKTAAKKLYNAVSNITIGSRNTFYGAVFFQST